MEDKRYRSYQASREICNYKVQRLDNRTDYLILIRAHTCLVASKFFDLYSCFLECINHLATAFAWLLACQEDQRY
jgi:hypothetical protein